LIALVLDQATKFLARHFMSLGESISIIPGFFHLTLNYNRGAAFGMAQGRDDSGGIAPLLIIITLVIIYAIVRLRGERARSRGLAVGLGLLLGGAVGNLIDRLAFGYVTDFLDIGVTLGGKEHYWPTFNLADVAIVAGVVLFMNYVWFVSRREQQVRP
jgi:signal peptidase II